MTWDPAESPSQLTEAVDRFDRERVAELCAQLVEYVRTSSDAYLLKAALRILKTLRRKRHFLQMQQIADAFIQFGLDRPGIRRQYAQALLDQGNLTAGVGILEPLINQTGADPGGAAEHSEACGLLGRAFKQMYVAAGPAAAGRRRLFLERAVRAYHDVYTASQQRWHGINVVALLARASRDGTPLGGFPQPDQFARTLAADILAQVEALGDAADTWDYATALEACVALDRPTEALEWLADYVASSAADAFELASTLRQLTEVWQLSQDRDPARLVPRLSAALLQKDGGEIEVGAADLNPSAIQRLGDRKGLEKDFGSEGFNSLTWFRGALQRCRAVARIEDPYQGGVGTGFLVSGASLHPSLPEVVLVTNAHILADPDSPEGRDPKALDPDQALVTFRALDSPTDAAKVHRVTRVLWSSLPHRLDATLATLDAIPPDVAPCPVASNRPLLDQDPPTRTYIIGHPDGREQPMFSIRDNLLLDLDDTRVHYRTPTLGGSSGSPVFNANWQLIALHHAGLTNMPKLNAKPGTYPANEGIWIDRIKLELAAALG